jgi:hypothetical protein
MAAAIDAAADSKRSNMPLLERWSPRQTCLSVQARPGEALERKENEYKTNI